jgi:hypothetical protein
MLEKAGQERRLSRDNSYRTLMVLIGILAKSLENQLPPLDPLFFHITYSKN